MNYGKVTGPSGVEVEVTSAAGDKGATMILDLAIATIRDGKASADWGQSNVYLYGKG